MFQIALSQGLEEYLHQDGCPISERTLGRIRVILGLFRCYEREKWQEHNPAMRAGIEEMLRGGQGSAYGYT